MFFRWLHKSWRYFWGIVLSILLLVLLLAGAAIGILQLEVTQNYLAGRIEKQVEQTYRADLSIGQIDGFLPFRLRMQNVLLRRPDSLQGDTLASIRSIDSEIDIWGLFQNEISITGFSVEHPEFWFRVGPSGRIQFLERIAPMPDTASSAGGLWLGQVEILAPTIQISEGRIHFGSLPQQTQTVRWPRSFTLSELEANLFVEWNENQRYLDIESLSATTQNLKMGSFSVSGQLYSDQRYLELNSFFINLGNSQLILNGEVDGVNLYEPGLAEQFWNARYNLMVESPGLYPRQFNDILPSAPDVEGPFSLQFQAEGTADSLRVERAGVGLGESVVSLNGLLKNLKRRDELAYQVQIDKLHLRKEDIRELTDTLQKVEYRALENLQVTGKAGGTMDSLSVDLALSSPVGELAVQAAGRLAEPYRYTGSLSGKKLSLSFLAPATLDTTSINFEAHVDGRGITLEEAVADLRASFYDSRIDSTRIDSIRITSRLDAGLWEQEFSYLNGEEEVQGSGWVDFRNEETSVTLRGKASNVDIARLAGDPALASTKLNFNYNVEMQSLNPDRVQGRANLDVQPSLIGGDSVRAHQFYMDLNSPEAPNRSFRLTSSLFDMKIRGKIIPSDILEQGRFWATYLKNRLQSEILMTAPPDTAGLAGSAPRNSVVIDGSLQAKDLSLIRKYLPGFPSVDTDSKITFNINTDGTRLLLSAEMQADTLRFNQTVLGNSRAQMTASFRSDRSLKEFSAVDLQSDISRVVTDKVTLDSVGLDLAFKRDSLHYTQQVNRISDNARFNMELRSSLADTAISVFVEDFFVGNKEYAWTNQQSPALIFERNGAVVFNDFRFQNKNESVQLRGRLSADRQDSLVSIIRDVNLKRISGLIKGKIDFGGILNGTLVTRSLTRHPTVQGRMSVNRFALNDRLVGDLTFNSQYNRQRERFDTRIEILTDSTKYENYLERNDGIGQNIVLDGYVLAQDPGVQQDSVFYFDADFNQIDMWVIPLIVNNVFAEMEGQASGNGYISGNLQNFDFHADFETRNVYAKPRFLNTNYFVSGDVALDRQRGVVLDSLSVLDTKGGTGLVWGTIDLNDFKPITYLDLSLDMNGLQFLNSTFDREAPFYGNVSGTGLVRLTGSNNDLYLRTQNPIQLTNDSEVSIPLLEETELNESSQFIRFVDSFEDVDRRGETETPEETKQETEEDQLEAQIQDMTFSERFDLDLRFNSSKLVTVNLVFDPVTGEVLTAQGTGQMRLTMQDQDMQMFGRYNIEAGHYQFVTGEIISRRLDLEPGGTIVWEGEPDNARLDISAVYHARPNIAPLTAEGAVDPESRNSQQVPVDLIVEITGTLQSVENSYYFRLPGSMDLSSNSTLSYTINQINRDEQQKLLQATSILFTGQFIPMQGAGTGTASLGQSLSRGSTVLNPLLSNQVISPLLSSQINALLNSDVSRFDIDFNLNAYNEVDLGIALRLYNDRLILRREGQITGGGSQTTLGDRIGDLNATYRIRRGLALTAFHRQDQIIGNYGASSQTGDITPNVDGIGIEAQIQYNTWHELLDRAASTFNSVFGSDNRNDKDNAADEEKNKITSGQKATREEEK